MPNILILGATGYIGQAVSSSLVRSGAHTVYGLARTPTSARTLARQEIHPVQGSIADSAAYLSLIRTAPIDVVIDCSASRDAAATILHDLRAVGRERLEQAREAGVRCQKLGFVYTSGVWVHGDAGGERVSDLSPVGVPGARGVPPKMVAWRPKLEQEIISAPELDAMVVRPAVVYGRGELLLGMFWGQIKRAVEEKQTRVEVKASVNSRVPWVHVDDVGAAIHAAAEKLPLIAGTGVYPVFDLVTSQESLKEVLEAAARELGYKGIVDLVGPGDDFLMQALNMTINTSGSRAQELLGWQPKKIGLVKDMDTYVMAWEATI